MVTNNRRITNGKEKLIKSIVENDSDVLYYIIVDK